jgi:hypothetical protein
MEKISWTDRVRNKEVLLTVKEEGNVLHTIKRRQILLVTSCVVTLLKHIIEGMIARMEIVGGRERRCKQILDELKSTRYCKLKEEMLDHSVENSLWTRPWSCHKTDYGMMMILYIPTY